MMNVILILETGSQRVEYKIRETKQLNKMAKQMEAKLKEASTALYGAPHVWKIMQDQYKMSYVETLTFLLQKIEDKKSD